MTIRGASLLEAVAALGLLGLLMALVFGTFHWGHGHFQLGLMRSGVQVEAHRAMAALETDLRQGQAASLLVASRLAAERARDAICTSTMAEWRDPDCYDPLTGLPRRDRYVVFFATQETAGRLARLVVDPGGPATGPWRDFPGAWLTDEIPALTPPVTGRTVLAQSVDEFRVVRLPGEALSLTLRLRGRTQSHSVGPARPEECLEVRAEVRLAP